MDTQMLGASVQPSSSLSNIVHVATANKAMYALAEVCVIIIYEDIPKLLIFYRGENLTCIVCMYEPLLTHLTASHILCTERNPLLSHPSIKSSAGRNWWSAKLGYQNNKAIHILKPQIVHKILLQYTYRHDYCTECLPLQPSMLIIKRLHCNPCMPLL